MCRDFKRTFSSYQVKDIAWPELAPDLTLRKFLETCVAESQRRMQVFDPDSRAQPCCPE